MTPKRHIVPVFVPHLGCPNDCVFCNQRRISGQKEPQTPENVKNIIETALLKIPENAPCELAFYGGSFTAIPEEEQISLLSVVKPYIDTGRIGEIRVSTRPDCINEAVIERLIKFGVKTVELGVQSLDEAVLKASERGHTAEDAENAVKLLRTFGFNIILQMMTGLPASTAEKDIYTAEKIIALQPDGVRIYPTVIVHDTPLYDMWREGEYREHTVKEAVELCAKLTELFDAAGIPVIRLGLNPTEELSGGGAAGGAYHPAFGELVKSASYLKRAVKILEKAEAGENIVISVAPGQVSLMTGQKRCNIDALKKRFGFRNVKIIEDNMLKKGEISLLNVAKNT